MVIAHPWAVAGSPVEAAIRDHFDVLLRTSDPSQALAALRTAEGAILIVEIRPPDFAGAAVVRAVKARRREAPIVVAAVDPPEDLLAELLVLDVEGLVVNARDAAEIVACVRDVSEGRQCLDHRVVRGVVKTLSARLSALREIMRLLTQREIEIVRLVTAGLTNKEIGARLFVTEGTVKVHLHNIFEKLQVRDRKALALHAKEKGLA